MAVGTQAPDMLAPSRMPQGKISHGRMPLGMMAVGMLAQGMAVAGSHYSCSSYRHRLALTGTDCPILGSAAHKPSYSARLVPGTIRKPGRYMHFALASTDAAPSVGESTRIQCLDHRPPS